MVDGGVRDLAGCLAIHRARRARTEGDHRRAAVAEAAAQAAHAREQEALADAAREWREHMRGGFDPVLAGLLGRQLVASAARVEEAHEGTRTTQARRASCAAIWREQDARCRQTDTLLTKAQRDRTRSADERALAALADRVTFDRGAR